MTTRFRRSIAIALPLCLAWHHAGFAQGTKDDYDRANRLQARYRDLISIVEVRPHWLDDGRFWYRRDLPHGRREFVVVDPSAKTKTPAFDHLTVASKLFAATGTSIVPSELPIDAIEVREGSVRFKSLGKNWSFDTSSRRLTEVDAATVDDPKREEAGPDRRDGGPRSATSPDGKWAVRIEDHDVHLVAKEGGEDLRLTADGTADHFYEGDVRWSPDSSRFVAVKHQKEQEHAVYFVESSPKFQVQPKLHKSQYLKPGDRIAVDKPHLFDVPSKKEIPVGDDLFPNPWSIDNLRWLEDSSRFTFLYNQRGHQVLREVSVDGRTGEAKAIVDESSKTFIDYAGKTYGRFLDSTKELLWMSERDGWNHLYLVDSAKGEVKNQITRGEWVVRKVGPVFEDDRVIWFTAGGIRPGQDPYYTHASRVNFDGTGLVILTEGDGTHAVEASPDHRYLIDTYSRVDLAPVVELRDAVTGKLVVELERADDSALKAAGWAVPERFSAKGRDGVTDIFGVIYRPTHFDPNRKYPVVEEIYAGPHDSHVPKAFATVHGSQAMAELGFIVVQIDGMGTSNRSKAFHDVCWKNLADAGLPDRIAWMKKAAEARPFMDLSRVGVYGGSAGGQNALGALLFHGDFYKVAVADCGCHDNRMDKIWWNELWMGWPVGPHYADQSNVTNAHKLTGKLLLMVGEMDRNVDPASTMQVVNALVKADKDFDLLVIPGGGHGGGGSYAQRRRRDFLVRHLLGVEPRHDTRVESE